MGFMLAGSAISVWMFFGQLFSHRHSAPSDPLVTPGHLEATVKSDLYLVEFAGALLPSLGDAAAISSDLPGEVDRSFVGSTVSGMRIVGLVPAGSRVSVTGASRTMNTPLELRGVAEGYDGEFDLSFVQDYSAGTPSLSARLFSPLQE